VGQIISSNAHRKFHVYKDYCRNKPYQDKILQKLRNSNDEFVNIIKSIEEDPKCQMLRMDSFLMLPMQRITRLPLLVNAIIQRTQSIKEKTNCEDALTCLTNLVLDCNESARESQDAEETAAIFEKIEFPKNTSSVPYPGQFLLKGDFIRNQVEQQGIRGSKLNWSFQKKKPTLYWLILFSNQLFITRKKSSGKFEVMDMISPGEISIKPVPNYEAASKDFQHYFMLQSNKHDGIYFLAARTQSEVDRWRQTLGQLNSQRNLQVEAIFLYEAKRDDELSFTVGDIIRVSQIQPDGWYYGRKLSTDETGWFPGNYCAEC
jgi:neuronal guanine nucleotide exchange factor